MIYNPVSFESVDKAVLDQKKVLAIGRFAYQKGFDILINLWKNVDVKHPDWTLDIYGDGADKEKYSHLIAQLGLQDKVTLFPATSQVRETMLKYSILCFPSRYEGFGLVLAEAMECGLPCVAFDCPSGPAEIIRDGEDGFLVNLGDGDAYINRVNRLIENPQLRKDMGKLAYSNIKRFSLDNIMSQWVALFENLLNNSPKQCLD